MMIHFPRRPSTAPAEQTPKNSLLFVALNEAAADSVGDLPFSR